MSGIDYRETELYCDGVPLAEIAATVGTPTFVYSADTVLDRYLGLHRAFSTVPHSICFAVKTNSNLGVLGTLARTGSGFDIVSGGELHRLLHIGVHPSNIVFAGVGKSGDEIRAALRADIGMFNVESKREAELLSATAQELQRTARVALRVNPDLEAGAHHYISTGTTSEKFGLPRTQVPDALAQMQQLPSLDIRGLHCHIGSQILHAEPFRQLARVLASLTLEMRQRGVPIDTLNLGGGLGIRYKDEIPLTPEEFAAAVLPELSGLGVRILVEPGRYLVGNAGALLARVLYRKETGHKSFLIVDAGMNDLLRPSLYGAHHAILPVHRRPQRGRAVMDVVGPLCESGDFLARAREMERLDEGDLLAIAGAGAYGFTMSSNYNSRPRAAEVLVCGSEFQVVRERENLDDLLRGERDWSPSTKSTCEVQSAGPEA